MPEGALTHEQLVSFDVTYFGGIWTLTLGMNGGVRVAPEAPTLTTSCLLRLTTAKYWGKSLATMPTVRPVSTAF